MAVAKCETVAETEATYLAEPGDLAETETFAEAEFEAVAVAASTTETV